MQQIVENIQSFFTFIDEDSEPCAVLRDPRDGRSVFVVYNNRARGTSSLVKLTKSSASGAIVNWDFLVSTASMVT